MQVQTNPSTPRPDRLLRLPDVIDKVGLQKTSIYEMSGRNPPAFPRPIKLSRRAVCWTESSIDAWIQERVAAGGQS
jgi:prophage regulatory protein